MAMSDDSKYQRRDQASARLGEKLLQGWTMLATHCPSDNCFTPLMRNKQGQMFCVGCDRFVITEEEAQRQQQERESEREREEKEQQERARAAQISLAELQAQRERSWQQPPQQVTAPSTRPQSHNEPAAAPAGPAPAKRKAEASAAIDDDVLQATRRQTLVALYKKLEELTQSLSPSDHSERIATTTKAMQDLVSVIQALAPRD
ncbi:hypothetical protein ATCC90586_003614 [Pythium insidiosum]|nr:hypothetical protein ATCC90586_003614 [Pythium insidiosum]